MYLENYENPSTRFWSASQSGTTALGADKKPRRQVDSGLTSTAAEVALHDYSNLEAKHVGTEFHSYAQVATLQKEWDFYRFLFCSN